MEEAHHQYGGEYALWTCHTINTEESVQYRTTETAQGVASGCIYLGKIIFHRQSYYNSHFILPWLNADVLDFLLGC